jgi:demethoxyubiquinone hydroxylase (CLK1/Coq7/Cat5 family)
MKQIKITGRTVIKIAFLSFSAFILFGIGIHFLGFRVAIRFSPEMTKEIEAHYRENLQALQKQLPHIESKINSLKELKEQFSELSTPSTGKKPAPM